MFDMDVCYHCMEMKRPYLFPYRSLKVYHWIDPHPNKCVCGGSSEGTDIRCTSCMQPVSTTCGHHVEMLCEDCAVVHWAEEYETSDYRKS